jgi:hypothetical protein
LVAENHPDKLIARGVPKEFISLPRFNAVMTHQSTLAGCDQE